MKFKSLRVFEEEGKFNPRIVERNTDELPEGDVLIKVVYSSLNYKDALSCTGNRGITKNYPHTPGIDAAGLVVESKIDEILVGDEVIVTGYDLGMNTDGGFGEYIRVPGDWVVKKPDNISLRESMVYGTAGYTAGQMVYEMQKDEIEPEDGEILVSGAAGGVGSHAVKFLTKLGYRVIGVVNSENEKKAVIELGAVGTISREESVDASEKPLLSQKWAGVIDTVGGEFLSTAVRSVKFGGVVATCGNVAGSELKHLTVYPFILRAVKLKGVASAYSSKKRRKVVWDKMGVGWKSDNFERNVKEVDLEGMLLAVENMLLDKNMGRIILKHSYSVK